jgi:hypothetical protein
MDHATKTTLDNLKSADKQIQNDAFFHILELSDQPVDWAYVVWDGLVADLTHKDNHRRAIAAQVLCNLAKSDPEKRMLKDLDSLLELTKDERFVTARHCMQALWKVGIVGKPQQQKLVTGLEHRFNECVTEKNCTLIRSDIIQSLKNIYDVVKDEAIKSKALVLIETEADMKYRKKYASLWKTK